MQLSTYRSSSRHQNRALVLAVALICFGFQQPLGATTAAPASPGDASQSADEEHVPSPDELAAEAFFNEAQQLFNQGTLEAREQAQQKLEQALQLWESLGDRAKQAFTWLNLGYLYSFLGTNPRALDAYGAARQLYQVLGDGVAEAVVLNHIGNVYKTIGERQRAIDSYSAALPLIAVDRNPVERAVTLNNIGTVYDDLNQREVALDWYRQALALHRGAQSLAGEAVVLGNIGKTYASMGRQEQSLEHYNQALSLQKKLGDVNGQAVTLNNLGIAAADAGRPDEAIDYYRQVLEISRQTGDRIRTAIALSNLGYVYSGLGEQSKALQQYEEALSLSRAMEDSARQAITLNNIGAVYEELGDRQQALDYYHASLTLRRSIGDRLGEAIALNNIANIQAFRGDRDSALANFQQALDTYRELGSLAGEANTLNNLGTHYSAIGDKQRAIEHFQRALDLVAKTGEPAKEAVFLNNLAAVFADIDKKQEALAIYQRALRIYRRIKDQNGEAMALGNIGTIHDTLGDKHRALTYYRQALPIVERTGNRYSEAITRNNIAAAYDFLGDKGKALDEHQRTLALRRALDDKQGEAVTLGNLGRLHDSQGNKGLALEHFEQALTLYREMTDRSGEGIVLNNLGSLYDDIGNKQQALEHYTQSLQIRRELEDRTGEATVVNNLGHLYNSLGEPQTASQLYQQALPIYQAVGDKVGEATTLSNLGSIASDLGETQRALKHYREALVLRRETGDRNGEGINLNNIGFAYQALDDREQALHHYHQALDIVKAIGDRALESVILNNLGGIYSGSDDLAKAKQYLGEALDLSRAIGDRAGETITLFNLALLKRRGGLLDDALVDIEAAIDIVESIRSGLVSKALRTSYFSTVQDLYEFYIDLLMELHRREPSKGHDAKALYANERSRARTLLELLNEANTDIKRGIAPELAKQQHRVERQLEALEQQRAALVKADAGATRLAELDRSQTELLLRYESLLGRIRDTNPRYAELVQPRPLTVARIQQQVLDRDTLLLQFALGDQRSFLWAVSSDALLSVELPGRQVIEELALDYHRQVSAQAVSVASPGTGGERGRRVGVKKGAVPVGPKLSQLLLAPVEGKLAEKRRLIIVGDGALHYVPFAALPLAEPESGSPPASLIDRHEVIYLPSVSAVAGLRQDANDRQSAPRQMAIFADPVFSADDERIQSASSVPPADASPDARQELPASQRNSSVEQIGRLALTRAAGQLDIGSWQRLPGTRREAEAIRSLVSATQSIHAYDFDANRATALSGRLNEFQIIHFATHGLLNSASPALSGLILSLFDRWGDAQDGFLRLNDIFNLDLSAELVVLSACQTALGKQVKGEGMIGLTRGFMYAGASRVLVSLWSVDDAATAELMARFYSALLVDKRTAAASLRRAQLEMRTETRWQAPYFWAAFTLQGDWRNSGDQY